MFCVKCGATLKDGALFCTSCGTKLSSEPEAPVQETAAAAAGAEAVKESAVAASVSVAADAVKKAVSGDKKNWMIGAVAAAAVLLVLFAGFFLFRGMSGGGVSGQPVIYLKDDGLMVHRQNKSSSYKATGNADYSSRSASELVQLSEDGKLMFFADDYAKDGTFRLYYRKSGEEKPSGKDADDKGIRIASGVSSFSITEDGKNVAYIKDERLHVSNLKDDKTISSDVSDYCLSSDGKKVIYKKNAGSSGFDLYLCGLGKNDEPEKIDTEISRIDDENIAGSYQKIYYIKDGALYIKETGKDKSKITNDASHLRIAGNQVYVLKEGDAPEGVNEKVYTLYRVKDGDLEKITDHVLERNFKLSQNAISYVKAGPRGSDKDKDKENRSLHFIQGSGEPTEDTTLSMTNLSDSNRLSLDGNYYFALEDYKDDKGLGELYRYKLTALGLTERVKIHDEVSVFSVYESNGSFVVCAATKKSGDNTVLGVYTGGKYSEISDNGQRYSYKDGALYYFEDYNTSKGIGTLVKYENGKKESIAADVYSRNIRSKDFIVYIRDYSTSKEYGDLYYKKGSAKPVKVDSDVSRIVW